MPRRTATFRRRPRLTSSLDAADPSCVVLVSAPAGYGKTLLLADWAARRDGTAWLTLDGGDNVDRRFWAGVLAALATGPAIELRRPPRSWPPSAAAACSA